MMNKITFEALLSIFVFLSALHFVQPVSAHGGEPRLEISPESLNPGSVLDIRGVDFEIEEEISLTLIGSQGEIPLGNVTGDVEGIFLLTITLPVDLAEGTYIIRARTDDHVVDSPQIKVSGMAVEEGGGQGPRDDDDSLLAPMPAFPQPTPVPYDPSMDSESVVKPLTPAQLSLISLGVLTVLVLITILGLRLRKKRQ